MTSSCQRQTYWWNYKTDEMRVWRIAYSFRVFYLPQHRTLSTRHPLALHRMRSTGCWPVWLTLAPLYTKWLISDQVVAWWTPEPFSHGFIIFHLQWVPELLEHIDLFHVNKSCKIECCGNKTHRIIQNMILSHGLELKLGLSWMTNISGHHPLFYRWEIVGEPLLPL